MDWIRDREVEKYTNQNKWCVEKTVRMKGDGRMKFKFSTTIEMGLMEIGKCVFSAIDLKFLSLD